MKVVLHGISGRHPSAKAGAAAAIRSVSISANNGEHVAVIGPSGAGKTTLLHLMACALKPEQGQLLLDGADPWTVGARGLRAMRRRLFLAPQTPPLPPRQRVVTAVLAGRLSQMGFWRSLRSLFYPVDIPAAHAALSRFDLADKLFDRVDRLSGGERQRVGLSRGLVSGADLFLVDEPLSALDPTRAEQAMLSLTQGASEQNATLVCTLHQVEMALKHFPRIIGLRDGEVFFDLAAKDVTQDVLMQLYAQHLDELSGPAPERPPLLADQPLVPMNCR